MIELYIFQKKGFKLLIPEVRDFVPTDLERLRDLCFSAWEEGKILSGEGIAIASTPEVNPSIPMLLNSYFKYWSSWQGGFLKGQVLVSHAFGGSPRKIMEVIPCRLPCLECERQGIKKELLPHALRPYCEQHEDKSPHRMRSRHRPKTTKTIK